MQNKKSRKKQVVIENYEPKEKMGPGKNEPTPTVIFHGIKQKCEEEMLVNLVQKVHEGTKAHAECIEIGDGITTSLITTMNH